MTLSRSTDDRRVIRFRPRMGTLRGSHRWNALNNNSEPDDSSVVDLTKYEWPESDDDYRHRMIVNAISLVFTILLILAGIWLADMMAHA
jgi:hypothetical protein